MKKFSKSIQIDIQIDTIADMLLKSMRVDFPHNELVVEAIIGRKLATKDMAGIGMIYNALNGHTGDIDFKIGDTINPENLRLYGFWTPESITLNNSVMGNVTSAIIVGIDLYADSKLIVEFKVPDAKGGFTIKKESISHINCTLVV